MSIDDAYAVPAAVARRQGAAFWAVAFAFLIVMAFATLPSPLYGLYRVRDHLSALTVTVVYAVFAGGTITALILERVVVARFGRRGAMLGAVATMIVAAALLAAWKTLPGLLVGRVLTGVSVGLAAGTATTYLIELRLRDDRSSTATLSSTRKWRRLRRSRRRTRYEPMSSGQRSTTTSSIRRWPCRGEPRTTGSSSRSAWATSRAIPSGARFWTSSG
jgi:hypothetical protein